MMIFESVMKRTMHIAVIAFALVCATQASSATITVESGGISALATDTSTVGSSGDPWLISETMTGAGTLKFASTPLGTTNSTGTGHSRGKWISKTVLNNTGSTWTSFELELQVILGTASGGGDGLSFADGSSITGSFSSNQFSGYTRIEDARDYLNFNGGDVLDGESVTFNFAITDNSGNDPFYLLQTPNRVDAIPEPETYAMMLAGLGLLGFVARRRKQKAA